MKFIKTTVLIFLTPPDLWAFLAEENLPNNTIFLTTFFFWRRACTIKLFHQLTGLQKMIVQCVWQLSAQILLEKWTNPCMTVFASFLSFCSTKISAVLHQSSHTNKGKVLYVRFTSCQIVGVSSKS